MGTGGGCNNKWYGGIVMFILIMRGGGGGILFGVIISLLHAENASINHFIYGMCQTP